MKSPKILMLFGTLILLAFLPGCTGSGTWAAQKPAIQLEPCSVGAYQAQCGTLRVYENREARRGERLA